MAADPDTSNPGRRFLGYVLVAVGALLTLLSGACTLTWLGFIAVSVVRSPTRRAGVVPAILVALPVGGLPIAVGLAMIAGGRSLSKPQRPPLLPSAPSR